MKDISRTLTILGITAFLAGLPTIAKAEPTAPSTSPESSSTTVPSSANSASEINKAVTSREILLIPERGISLNQQRNYQIVLYLAPNEVRGITSSNSTQGDGRFEVRMNLAAQ